MTAHNNTEATGQGAARYAMAQERAIPHDLMEVARSTHIAPGVANMSTTDITAILNRESEALQAAIANGADKGSALKGIINQNYPTADTAQRATLSNGFTDLLLLDGAAQTTENAENYTLDPPSPEEQAKLNAAVREITNMVAANNNEMSTEDLLAEAEYYGVEPDKLKAALGNDIKIEGPKMELSGQPLSYNDIEDQLSNEPTPHEIAAIEQERIELARLQAEQNNQPAPTQYSPDANMAMNMSLMGGAAV